MLNMHLNNRFHGGHFKIDDIDELLYTSRTNYLILIFETTCILFGREHYQWVVCGRIMLAELNSPDVPLKGAVIARWYV